MTLACPPSELAPTMGRRVVSVILGYMCSACIQTNSRYGRAVSE